MKTKVLRIAAVACLSIIIASTSTFAAGHKTALTLSTNSASAITTSYNDQIDKAVVTEASNWLRSNYQDFYNLRNAKANIIKLKTDKATVCYTIALSCETKCLFRTVEEIPFVKGLLDACSKRKLTEAERIQIESIIASIEKDAFSDEWSELNVDVIIEYNKQDKRIIKQMYYDDGMTNTRYKIEELSLDYDRLYNEGQLAANEIIGNDNDINTDETLATDTYNGTVARNYSRTYSSNPSTCDIDGSSCGVRQKRSAWNTSQYPYYSLFKHNDCADFVSQALSKGGIPEVSGSSGWYRTKNGSSGTWSASWVNVSSLKNYMISHSYWVSSSYSNCPAGGTLITDSGGHVVMIDYNDGTTHKFNGHTNDRKKYVFSNQNGYLYYKVRRLVYPTR